MTHQSDAILASGTLHTVEFTGPGRVEATIELPTVPGIVDPRILVLMPLLTGERVKLPQLFERPGGGLSGYHHCVEREALGPIRLQITVERTDDGREPELVFEWYILGGPKPPLETGSLA